MDFFLKHIKHFVPSLTFIHEFTHYLESLYNKTLKNKPSSNYKTNRDYVNSEEEIQAELISGLHAYRNDVKRGTYPTFKSFRNSFIDYMWTDEWEKSLLQRIKNV